MIRRLILLYTYVATTVIIAVTRHLHFSLRFCVYVQYNIAYKCIYDGIVSHYCQCPYAN